MRALHYSSIEHTDLSTTLNDAKKAGVISAKEYDLLNNTTLLRAHAFCFSFYMLSVFLFIPVFLPLHEMDFAASMPPNATDYLARKQALHKKTENRSGAHLRHL